MITLGRDIEIGDRVRTENGDIVTVKSISNGIYLYHRTMVFSNKTDGQVRNTDKFEVL